MSGYLASVVQRGAGMAQSTAVAAPAAATAVPALSSPDSPVAHEAHLPDALPVHGAGTPPDPIYSRRPDPEAEPRAAADSSAHERTSHVARSPEGRVESTTDGVAPAAIDARDAHPVETNEVRTAVVHAAVPATGLAAALRADGSPQASRVASAAPHSMSALAELRGFPEEPRSMNEGSPALLPVSTHSVILTDAPKESPAKTSAIVEVTLQPAPQPRVEIARRSSSLPASAPEALPIHVRIGKIEVKPPAPAAPLAPSTPKASAALGFDRYRRLRTYRS